MSDAKPMTADEIAALAELESKATRGEWKTDYTSMGGRILRRGDITHCQSHLQIVPTDDAIFIAAARNAVPRLIATIAAREAEIAQLKDLLREVSATSARIPANPVMATFSLNTLAKIDVALKESHND